MTTFVSKDAEAVAKALLEVDRLISRYLAPGPRNPARTISEIVLALDRLEAITAANRIASGYGLHVVK